MESSFGFVGKDYVILAADANASFRVFNLKVLSRLLPAH